MALLGLKQIFLSIMLLFGCAGGPDELELGYGHAFVGDSSLESWPINNEDSDWVNVGLVWKLKPTQVEVVNPVTPAVRWALEPVAQEPIAPMPDTEVGVVEDVTDAAEAFNAMDWLTRVLLIVLAMWILVIYRKQLGRLIPGSKNNNNKKPK